MVCELCRRARLGTPLKIRGSTAYDPQQAAQPPHDQSRIPQRSDPNAEIDPLFHQVELTIEQRDVQRDAGVVGKKPREQRD